MAGAGEVDHLLAGVPHEPGRMGVDEREPGGGAPVTEEPRLDVLGGERLPQQGIGLEVDLAHREVVVGPPPGVEGGELGLVRVGEPVADLVRQRGGGGELGPWCLGRLCFVGRLGRHRLFVLLVSTPPTLRPRAGGEQGERSADT